MQPFNPQTALYLRKACLQQQMRIFISSVDESGSKRTTRLTLANCTTTTQVIKQIAKLLGISKHSLIIKLKYEPHNLRIVEGWPISHYPVKNGSSFIVEQNEFGLAHSDQESCKSLEKIHEDEEEEILSDDSSAKLSFISQNGQHDESKYLDQCLQQVLEAVRLGNLDKIAQILKSEPDLEDEREVERIMRIKSDYLLNEVGQCGRNALHWAIHMKNIEIITFLMIKGSDPKLLTIDEYSPLQLAVQCRSPEIVSLLLEQKKVDPNQLTSKGTALHLAVLNEDMPCLQILLQNGSDPELTNLEHQKSIDICKNLKIKTLLTQRARLSRVIIPNITKGNVFKLSSFSRMKERILAVNPFRNQLTITSQQKIQKKSTISQITELFLLTEKKWLMKSDYFYFKMQIDEQQFTFGLKHQDICLRWVQAIKQCYRYVQNSKFNKIISAEQQIIEMLNDDKNQVKLHKRKIQTNSVPFRNSISIMSLKTSKSAQEELVQEFKNVKIQQKSENSSQMSRQTDSPVQIQQQLRQSEILLGSVLQDRKYSENVLQSAPPKQQFRSSVTFQDISPSDPEEIVREKSQTVSTCFRKNSQSKIEIVGQFKIEDKPKISFNDFQVIRLLGNGAFGKVYLAKLKKNGHTFALKVLNKKKLLAKKQLKYAVSEASILKKVECPFIIRLYYAFQTPTNLYMALDNCTNGDLSELITIKERISLSTSRFIISQIILAVQYLHYKKILYRDLKPENILIAKDGYICLTDFGLSKQNNFSSSFCGSPAYLSPQMLQKKGVGFSTDIYGIGCVLYQMLIGQPPYFDQNIDTLYENIKSGRLRFPDHVTKQAKSLINKLLERDINKRLGIKNMKEIKDQDFFKGFDWKKIERKGLQAPPEMFLNQQQQFNQLINLDKQEESQALSDCDYEKSSNMINRIKNFTFARQEEDYEISKFELVPIKH